MKCRLCRLEIEQDVITNTWLTKTDDQTWDNLCPTTTGEGMGLGTAMMTEQAAKDSVACNLIARALADPDAFADLNKVLILIIERTGRKIESHT